MRNKEMGNKNTKGRWNFREFREENSTKLKLDLIKWNFVDKEWRIIIIIYLEVLILYDYSRFYYLRILIPWFDVWNFWKWSHVLRARY
jgi:hypothetical protein